MAVDRLTGANLAIQCKFYAPGSTIGKADIDSFLSGSGKDCFAQRIIVSTPAALAFLSPDIALVLFVSVPVFFTAAIFVQERADAARQPAGT